MSRLIPTTSLSTIAIATAVASLAFPPVSCAMVPAAWSTPNAGAAPLFDLEIWSTGTLSLTVAELYGGKLRAFVQADIAIDSTTHGTDTINETAHGLLTGDGPFQLTSSGGLPVGLSLATNYWIIKITDNTFKLAATLADALAATPVVVAFSTDGTGTHTIADVATTMRVYWQSYGVLPTPIALTNQRGYVVRCSHRPETVAYALSGTLSAGTVSAAITPVMEQ